ncbi:hypothetical protein GN244_ATG10880 [Phytophthora infestans]|uniref:Uncharacterized protein n=1 Tax=Phytophthora infestans TaxID=4787 RepID=A0A833T3C0_PHYIN|nr:hypothetical protein GN244_ATG10880 [Phytophthora infestans]
MSQIGDTTTSSTQRIMEKDDACSKSLKVRLVILKLMKREAEVPTADVRREVLGSASHHDD